MTPQEAIDCARAAEQALAAILTSEFALLRHAPPQELRALGGVLERVMTDARRMAQVIHHEVERRDGLTLAGFCYEAKA